tara:strand:+ start:2065 stop:2460 length:396 start_codon:yes stop_codon:yes gene_type:complete
MIQRIQSLYLLISAISMLVISFNISVYQIGITKYFAYDDMKLFVLTLAVMTFSVLALLKFKSRLMQIKFIRLALVLLLVLCIRLTLLNFYSDAKISINIIIFVLSSFISLIMALRGVLKDDKLVRSSERIR